MAAQISLIDDVAGAVAAWNEVAARHGWPRVQVLNPVRRASIVARLRDAGGPDGWAHALERAAASDFLCGRSPRSWGGLTFDWLIQPGNFIKVMEGNYDNRAAGCGGGSRFDTLSDRLDAAGRYRRTSGADLF